MTTSCSAATPGAATLDGEQHVLPVRHGLEMLWIHAGVVLALVVNLGAPGDRPDERHVEDTMGVDLLPIDVRHPVASAGPPARPLPARRPKAPIHHVVEV